MTTRTGPWILLGVALAFAISWAGLVVGPYRQLGQLQPVTVVFGGDPFPPPTVGLVELGRRVYLANGCADCHTQQVRPRRSGSDLDRDWGPRRSVPRDYLDQNPPLLGFRRNGPDLLNIGDREPDANWHHLHLYNPRAITPGSNMPSFRFLYERRRIIGQPSNRAVQLPPDWVIKPGFELVPSNEAHALVAYLLSLDHSAPLQEAGPP